MPPPPPNEFLSNMFHFQSGVRFSAAHEIIWRKARAAGGAVTMKFQQTVAVGSGANAVVKFGHGGPTLDREVSGGVCHAMCMAWIMFHAHEEDFWAWLQRADDLPASFTGPVTSAGYTPTARGPTRVIQDLQKAIYNKPGTELFRSPAQGEDWRAVTDRQFDSCGLVKTLYGQLAPITLIPNQPPNSILNELTPLSNGGSAYKIGGVYKMFGMRDARTLKGHYCALWVGQDVTYLDPNVGECWFPTVGGFRGWFFHYWYYSGYSQRYDQYWINSYSRKR
jgi:hypothetical protein